MERINYAQLIQDILTNHFQKGVESSTEIQLIFDQEHHHYQLLHLGWKEQKRIYGVIVHVDIKDNKIWIQRDGTEVGIANELIAAGVPPHDIVLGFQAPYKRKLTEFSVN
ncbi:MAG: XisI protein [Crocosphaera sp.]|nr:XisI protein [Crocosphaera sp.]